MSALFLDNTILVSFVVIVVVVAVAVVLLRYSHRMSQEKSARSALAAFGVQLSMAILIGLWLTHLFALFRDREQRRWALRQDHLVRLRTVLRADTDKLREIGRRATVEGHGGDINRDVASHEAELASLFHPDILSRDLAHHYPDYSRKKEQLLQEVQQQDAEYRSTIELVSKKLVLGRVAESRRFEVALSILNKCVEKGPGITLTTSASGYTYQSKVGWVSAGGSDPIQVPEELVEASKAFTAFRPDDEVVGHCESLKRREAGIRVGVTNLSAEARLLVEKSTLAGECEYTRLD